MFSCFPVGFESHDILRQNKTNNPHLGIHVAEEDDQTKRPTGHGLSWDKRVLEGGLSLGLDYSAQGQRCELQMHTGWGNTTLTTTEESQP